MHSRRFHWSTRNLSSRLNWGSVNSGLAIGRCRTIILRPVPLERVMVRHCLQRKVATSMVEYPAWKIPKMYSSP